MGWQGRSPTSITADAKGVDFATRRISDEVTITTSGRPTPVYRVSIGPGDVDRRVAVRRVLDDGREGLGDVLGDLLEWADGVLSIRTRDGITQVPEGRMVAGRLIPSAPPRRHPRA